MHKTLVPSFFKNSLLGQLPIGLRFMLLSALGFALMAACVKLVSSTGMPIFQIVAARAFISLVISYLDIKRKKIPVWGNNKPLLIARGTVGTLGLICVYYAIAHLPLAEATILQYLHPVFTAVLALLFLKERIQLSTVACIVLSILGLVITVKPNMLASNAVELPTFAVGIAMLGAFFSAVAYTIVKRLSKSEDSSVIVFYFPFIALPLSLFLLGGDIQMPTLFETGLLLLVGIFTQIGQVCLTKAMQTEAASKATAYSYIQVVFSILLGAFLFNELPSIWTLLGGSLIIIGTLINIFGSQRAAPGK
ncbi:DMT family transporter [Photobacterium rosenbergii]|uniref:DMT family transporter n=1 Tax=Photobacterium rosenbergii TaxID=294936 RepID=A0ABU3ZCY7_9GAMM|nr:DMT family transporter [Photobacterium rosenbergii]MDV5167784.1 DMT family transporter [Photobacterium rosenbergii]